MDAIYRVDSSDNAWLSGIVKAARPALDDGLGMMMVVFWMSARGVTAVNAVEDSALPLAEMGLAGARGLPDLTLRAYNLPVGTMTEVVGRKRFARSPVIRDVFLPLGVHDVMGVVCREPDGWGVNIFVPLRNAERIAPGRRVFWQRIAGHIQAAHRLRRRLGTSERTEPTIAGTVQTKNGSRVSWSVEYQGGVAHEETRDEALLDPVGRCLDARGEAREVPAREALRRAAITIDRAKAELLGQRNDADALGEWRALVDGRWSLLDRFDNDGRRFLVARRNAPGTMPIPLLDERERAVLGYRAAGHALKLIAYEMGYSLGFTSRVAQNAMRKLGLTSPADLVAFVQSSATGLGDAARLDAAPGQGDDRTGEGRT
jgi:DNA-binding CsgD family transcriptional regulator